VVTGTHGKTTTTSLTAYLLREIGADPSMLVGGFAHDFDGSFREGSGPHFVVEGDEYDTAFFDKTPKFLHYHPRTLVITSVEFDHADIYRDLDHVKQAFRTLVSRMPADGTIVAALAHQNVRDVVAEAPCRVVGYGLGDARGLDWRATATRADASGTRFRLERPGHDPLSVNSTLYGDFNVENALAALAVTGVLGCDVEAAALALSRFQGVKRRQEVRGEAAGVLVLDDFAHHPTAVAASIGAACARYPGRRVFAIFEPRTNTSRRAVFQDRYAESFGGAAEVIVRCVPDTPIYSATGEVTERFSAERLVSDLRARGIPAIARDEVDEIVEYVAGAARVGDVLLVMSNGDFEGIWEKLLAALAARAGASRGQA
jgi:UDP-N-acetylmuramate: L-alanyl-gamma-D-glutamyl-meso-diaminopimelate ligase